MFWQVSSEMTFSKSPQADEPAVVMHTAGGRRKRLGVGGKVGSINMIQHKTKKYIFNI